MAKNLLPRTKPLVIQTPQPRSAILQLSELESRPSLGRMVHRRENSEKPDMVRQQATRTSSICSYSCSAHNADDGGVEGVFNTLRLLHRVPLQPLAAYVYPPAPND